MKVKIQVLLIILVLGFLILTACDRNKGGGLIGNIFGPSEHESAIVVGPSDPVDPFRELCLNPDQEEDVSANCPVGSTQFLHVYIGDGHCQNWCANEKGCGFAVEIYDEASQMCKTTPAGSDYGFDRGEFYSYGR